MNGGNAPQSAETALLPAVSPRRAGAREAILGDMGEVREKWHTRDTHNDKRETLRQIGHGPCSPTLHAMYRVQTIEQVLHQKVIFLHAMEIPAPHNELAIWNHANSQIVYAVGPSGRGRTFIGAKQAAVDCWYDEWERNDSEMYTTVFLDTRLICNQDWHWADDNASGKLLEYIQEYLHELYPMLYDKAIPLDLHFSVVLFGAFTSSTYDFAGSRDVVNQLYGRLKGIVTASKKPRVIVMGKMDELHREWALNSMRTNDWW
jgi:hypothetical protein